MMPNVGSAPGKRNEVDSISTNGAPGYGHTLKGSYKWMLAWGATSESACRLGNTWVGLLTCWFWANMVCSSTSQPL